MEGGGVKTNKCHFPFITKMMIKWSNSSNCHCFHSSAGYGRCRMEISMIFHLFHSDGFPELWWPEGEDAVLRDEPPHIRRAWCGLRSSRLEVRTAVWNISEVLLEADLGVGFYYIVHHQLLKQRLRRPVGSQVFVLLFLPLLAPLLSLLSLFADLSLLPLVSLHSLRILSRDNVEPSVCLQLWVSPIPLSSDYQLGVVFPSQLQSSSHLWWWVHQHSVSDCETRLCWTKLLKYRKG